MLFKNVDPLQATTRTESLETLLQSFPLDQWWRLFIDGYRQYSLINRELNSYEKGMRENGVIDFREEVPPACQ